MLRAFAFQLYKDRVDSRSELDRFYMSCKGGPETQALSESLFEMMRRTESKIRIVLDAMDECTTRPQLLKWMSKLFSQPGLDHVQLIATSRAEKDFLNSIPTWIDAANCVTN